MATSTRNPFVSFVNAYCGLVANQLSDMSTEFDKAVSKSKDVFNELASRGETVEADLKKAMSRSDKMNKSVKNWFEAFSFGNAQRDNQLNELSKKVDNLIDQVAILAEKKAQEKAAATKRTTTRKTTAKTTAKAAEAKAPAAKKAATAKATASKTTTRKTTTRKPAAKKTTAAKPATKKAAE